MNIVLNLVTKSRFISRAILCLVGIFALIDYASGQTALPEGVGKETVQNVCSQCHTLTNVIQSKLTGDEWQDVVKDMIGKGASLRAEEIPLVVEYLSRTFPKDRPANTNERIEPFVPVTDAVLQNPDPADWLRWRHDHTASGYSPLDQVNRQNVQKLRLAWTWAMEPGQPEQEPIVYRGVMFLPQANGVVQALDARNGAFLWEYRRKLPERLGNGGSRNIAIYQDKIFLTTQDSYLIALDARNGKVLWETAVADYRQQVNYSSGPMAADGKVFIGQTCQFQAVACALSAHDAATGKLLWRRESVAGPSDPKEHNDTWGGVPYEKRMKGSLWLTGSYDPDLKLLFWTTASASPYPEILKGTGTGALLYTNSILALDSNTGAIKWFFQMLPRDNHDEDHEDNPILADVQVGFTMRKAVFVLGKPGVLWAFDRENGKYLWHNQLVSFQNLYENIDPETGKITINDKIFATAVGQLRLACPGMRGGKLFQTKAYNPRTNAIYSPVSNECTMNEVLPLTANPSGLDYNRIVPMEGSGGNVGRLTAVSASTGQLLWKYDQPAAMGSVLTTGGGLVFVGDLYRYFRAFDAETGKVLWETPLSAPVTGYPISYSVNNKQHVAVAVGGATPGTRHMAQLYPELKTNAGGNILMVFTAGE